MSDDTFSGYLLGARLPQHTHNRLYEAQSIDSPLPNALIKIFSVRRLSDDERSRFLHEAELYATLHHPAILPLLAAGIKGRLPYVVMPYVRSASLRSQMTHASLPLQNVLPLLIQLGQALTYAHQYQIVHGNIKPENILFLSSDRVSLADFQFPTLAELAHSTFSPTPEHYPYRAPEQFSGPPTPASDQYALACVAYELLLGHLPGEHDNELSLLGRREQVLLKALAPDPKQRYESVAQFIQALQAAFSLEQKRADEKGRQLITTGYRSHRHQQTFTQKLVAGNPTRVGAGILLAICILLLIHTIFPATTFPSQHLSRASQPGNSGAKSSIVASLDASPSFVNLTAEGTTDWTIWGYQSANRSVHKNAGHGQIGPLSYININPQTFIVYGGSQTQYSWSDGVPVATTPYLGQSGIEMVGANKCGFQFSVMASTTAHTLRIYVGVDDGQGELVATLSDGTSYHATTFSNVTTAQGDFYELRYQANSNNQLLKIRYTVSDDTTPHSIMLEAVTLQ